MKDSFKSYKLTASKFEIPEAITESPGIPVGTDRIKSVLLSTDLSYIANLNIDSVLVIHPFETTEKLNTTIQEFCEGPVFLGIGGGFRQKEHMMKLAVSADKNGADGIVISRPTDPNIIKKIRGKVSSKLIYSILIEGENIHQLVDAGVDMFNVSTGENTAKTIQSIRQDYPDIPIMANGGPFDSTIRATITAGADAIVYNPPTATEMMRSLFDKFRKVTG